MRIVHQLPGRVRIELPELYRNPLLAFRLKEELLLHTAVIHVEATPLTARLLIHYSPCFLTLPTLIQVIRKTLVVLHTGHRKSSEPDPLSKPPAVFELESLPIVRQLAWTAAAGVLFLYVNSKGRSSAKTEGARTILNFDTALTVLSGYPILKTAVDHFLQKGRLSTEFLASLASFTSIAIEESRMGSFINLVVYVSTLLRTIAAERTRDKIQTILAGRQIKARLVTSHGTCLLPAKQLTPGDRVMVKTGERLPADGQALKGTAVICAHLPRGNSEPKKVEIGQKVYAGSCVQHGELTVLVKQVGSATYIGRILQLLEQGSCKSPLMHEKVMDWMHKVSLTSLSIAASVYLITGDAKRASAMLIAGAPGAAGLASSMALGAAAGQAACHGVLVKDDRHIEAVGKADTVLFDKEIKPDDDSGPIIQSLRRAKVTNIGLLTSSSPQQKADAINQLQCKGHKIAVVGDASEAALALAAADVGIAPTSGDKLNLQQAHILIIGQDYRRVPWLRLLARNGIRIAWQNTILSLGINIVGISLGLFNYLTPLAMAVLHNVSTFGIMFNSGRLLLPAPTSPKKKKTIRLLPNGKFSSNVNLLNNYQI